MTATLIVTILIIYFAMLAGISWFTSRSADNDAFFLGERKSPWYVVSFGMIGASLSGVTFISVPGGVDSGQFSYMQMVFGYFVGYLVVSYVLMPIYYRMKLTSIYEYLEERFGFWSYKTGAAFFLLSRVVGASIRLLLVASVLQQILFDDWGIPFWVTVVISVLLIWIYTNKGGIKTIIWTDTLQTAFMLFAVIFAVYLISDALDLGAQGGILKSVADSSYSQIFFFDDWLSGNYFWKHFLGGMFITIGMTGLDQDMMQKNLSCKNIKDAQKNMVSMATVLVVVNLIFYVLDNYAPLRDLTDENLDKDAHLFPVKDALQYVQSSPLGYRGNSSKGSNLWQAENPMFGAVFTLHLKEVEKSAKDKRIEAEKEKEKKKEPAYYPSFDDLWIEENEDAAKLIWVLRDSQGDEVHRLLTSAKKGINRVNWNLKMSETEPIKINKPKPERYSSDAGGFMVTPGTYSVEVYHVKDGVTKQLIEKTDFNVVGLNNQTLLAQDNDELTKFRKEVAELNRKVDGSGRLISEAKDKVKLIEHALRTYPGTNMDRLKDVDDIKVQLNECKVLLNGDWIKSKHQFETEPGISGRIGTVGYQLFSNTTGVTETQRKHKAIAEEEYIEFRKKLDAQLIKIKEIEKELSDAKIPYIKGKDENWKED